jgi:Uma2 family endonuclease
MTTKKHSAVATATQVSLETYLHTVYEPDVDYVDGELEERNVGEFDHNILQRAILFWFYLHEKEWRIHSIQEQRTRVASTKVRIPDVSVFSRSMPVEQVFSHPQLIAVEVLSPEDRRLLMDKKIQNYIDFGVANIWVVDPMTREGSNCSDGNWIRAERFEVAETSIYLSLPELFRKIDEDAAE